MRDNKPFKFAPFSMQQKRLLTWWTDGSPYSDMDMIIADGSIRSGKTIAMIDSFFTWSMTKFKNENFILAGKSVGALRRNVLDPAFKIFEAKGISKYHNLSEKIIEVGTNTYYYFGANNEASQDVMQGLTAAGGFGDEVALFPQSFVDQMIGRCSVEGSKLFFNCNPEGPYHYVKKELIDKAIEKHILHLHFTLEDNLTLSPEIKARYHRMFSGLWFKRYILGMWVLAEGIIYDMFDVDKHTGNYHDLEPERWIVAADYGTANPCTFGLYGVIGNRAYLVKEYWWDSRKEGRQKTDGEYAVDFADFLDGIRPDKIFVDPSALSFIAELRKAGYKVTPALNEVLPGILLLSRMIAENRFFVDKSCTNTLEEFAAYVWDEKAQQKRGQDVPLKQNDHSMDRNRYFAYTYFHRMSLFSLQI